MMLTKHDRCQNEDATGQLCTFGPGHKCECKFTPYRPTDAQYEWLERGWHITVVKAMCVGMSGASTLKALSRRGYINLRYVNSRTWDYQLTSAGRRLLIDRPR